VITKFVNDDRPQRVKIGADEELWAELVNKTEYARLQ
jgi:hypothetical protein